MRPYPGTNWPTAATWALPAHAHGERDWPGMRLQTVSGALNLTFSRLKTSRKNERSPVGVGLGTCQVFDHPHVLKPSPVRRIEVITGAGSRRKWGPPTSRADNHHGGAGALGAVVSHVGAPARHGPLSSSSAGCVRPRKAAEPSPWSVRACGSSTRPPVREALAVKSKPKRRRRLFSRGRDRTGDQTAWRFGSSAGAEAKDSRRGDPGPCRAPDDLDRRAGVKVLVATKPVGLSQRHGTGWRGW